MGWSLLGGAVPLYPLYALFFTATGLTGGQISALFAVWSVTGIVAEVPTGALADRFSRRAALAASGVLQAVGFAAWLVTPGFWGFLAGFVLWGVGGALASGALEALLYDGLAATGAEDDYVRLSGRVDAAGLLAQVPAAGAAVLLYRMGGYQLAGWVSVGVCLAAALLALRLPEVPRTAGADDGDGYFATLARGVREAVVNRVVRTAVIALAALAGLDAVEEYFPVIAADWRVPTGLNPLAGLVVTGGGVAGAWLASRAGAGRFQQCLMLAGAALAAGVAALLRVPAGIVLLAVFYGLYRLVLVLVDARLQRVIETGARATVTSVAALATEVSALVLFAAWAAGGLPLVAALTALLALVPLAAKGVPLAAKGVPLAAKGVPLAAKGVPLAAEGAATGTVAAPDSGISKPSR
ncbi:MFS transporter [Dactylosporangium sp. AC04546]|uniref:MFS transporter n=1 Tax=Dactylosporangium sp. AC04546 TaxID=2862460 RepID=UPI002E7B2EDB|nr:MFS transporter [Dactylosporangium sp. AC04546]WVK79713.1 MFS transporter [Dactylosporangium sp. AC04546]